MSYVVLARRYRPQKFDDLVGQEHVSHTLKNALLQNRIAHAYLFTGPRGTGKTSAARILAKAIRCMNLQNGEPCNTCEACVAVNNGSSMDVVEIDAASNTGVDNIRDLRGSVEYMAAVGKYRIYVIDEVHMLSTAAFNALLKTLEEPPAHVIFIFATTELHKVLPTIQSRCQRFDFKKIPPALMTANLKEICAKEAIQIDEASIQTVVTESEGCLRDAQSLLDQAIALCGKQISLDKLEKSLGLMDRASFQALLRAVARHESGNSLKLCSQMIEKGVDPKVLLSRLCDFYSDLHYYTFTKQGRSPDPEQLKFWAEISNLMSEDEVIRALNLALKTQSTLGLSLNSSVTLESFVVKLSLQRPVIFEGSSENEEDKSGTAPARPSYGERGVGSAARLNETPAKTSSVAAGRSSARSGATGSSATPAASGASGNSPAAASSPIASANSPASSAGSSAAASSAGASTGPVAQTEYMAALENFIRNQKPAWTPVLQSITQIQVEDGIVKVRAKNDFAGKRLSSNDGIELLKVALKVPKVLVQLEAAASVTQTSKNDSVDILRQKHTMAKEHEAVQSALRIFDATISETKVLDDEPKSNPKNSLPNKGVRS